MAIDGYVYPGGSVPVRRPSKPESTIDTNSPSPLSGVYFGAFFTSFVFSLSTSVVTGSFAAHVPLPCCEQLPFKFFALLVVIVLGVVYPFVLARLFWI